MGTTVMPEPGQPILNTLGYFEHIGGHGSLPADWDVFLEFMEMHLKQRVARRLECIGRWAVGTRMRVGREAYPTERLADFG